MQSLNDIIVTDENHEAISRIASLAVEHDGPERLFMYGPYESGKTVLLRACAYGEWPTGNKETMFVTPKMVISALDKPGMDEFLGDLGVANLLFIDDFDDFLAAGSRGCECCKLLLKARNSLNGDTVVASRRPIEEYGETEIGGEIATFQQLSLFPLDYDGRINFVLNRIAKYGGKNISSKFTDDAVRFIATEFNGGLREAELLIYSLEVNQNGSVQEEIDVEAVRRLAGEVKRER